MSTDTRPTANAARMLHQHLEDEHHVLDYVKVAYKRRWIAIPAFLIVFLVGAMNSYRTTPVYEASTQLLIEKDAPKIGRLDTMFQDQEGWYNDEFYQTQYRILQSRSLARRTAELMDLPNHPSLKKAMEEPTGPLTVSGAVHGAIGWVEGLFPGRPQPKPAPESVEPEDKFAGYTGIILGSLTVAPVRNSRLAEIRFSSTDPRLAADMANAHAKAYIQQNMEMRFSASKEASDWLSGQLAEQRKKVEESEAALQRYKETHDAVAVEDRQNIVVQRLADLNSAATRAKTGRIEREAQYNQLKALQGTPAVDAFPAVVANEYI
jgi:polysaccharide biosynthesis transport protein